MEQIVHFFETIPFWYWWILTLGLLALEVMTGTTYLLWPAAAAVITGFSALFPFSNSWQLQILLFTITTGILMMIAAPRLKPWLASARHDHELLNERGTRKIGRKVSVNSDFSNGNGHVRLDDTLWLAESETGEDYPAETKLEITRVEGAKLYVKAIDQNQSE